MDILISLSFFSTAIIFLWISKAVYNDLFSPIGIFGFVQCFGLSMFHLKLFPYNPLSQFAWFCFLGGLFFFMLGCFIVSIFMKSMDIERAEASDRLDSSRLQKAIAFCFFIGIIGFTILLANLLLFTKLKSLANNSEELREKFVLPFYMYPWFFNVLTPSLAILYIRLTGRHKVKLSMVVVASLVMLFSSFSRSLGFMSLFMAFLTVSSLKMIKKPVRIALITALTGIVLFSAFHVFVRVPGMMKSVEKNDFSIKTMTYLAPAYGYFTIGFSMFDPYVADTKELDYGMNTFITVGKILKLVDSSIKVPEVHGKWYTNPTRGNVYTYLGAYYRDFGVIGIILLPLLQGILVTIPYTLMHRHGHYNLLLLNGLFSWCLLISFFSNHFRGNTTLFLALVSIFVGRYITRINVAGKPTIKAKPT